jgi:hypothetical protein
LAPLTAATGSVTRASDHRFRFVDREASPTDLVPVELGDSASRAFDIAHFDERESARLTRGPIAHDGDGAHLARGFEQDLQLGFGGLVRQVADIQLGIHHYSCISRMQIDLMAGSSGMLGRRNAGEAKDFGSDAEGRSAAVRKPGKVYHTLPNSMDLHIV